MSLQLVVFINISLIYIFLIFFFILNKITIIQFKYSLTCNGANSDNCLSCDSNDHRTLDGTECKCNDGYYNNSAALCASCHPFWLIIKMFINILIV